jgi:hypothetical protein
MSVMLSNLTGGGQLQAKVQALLSAAPARHIQMYFRDDRLEALARHRGLDGAVPNPRAGDLTAVYTQNGNGSKVDVYQGRAIDQVVQLHPDGSARVDRTVRLVNQTPPYTGIGPDIKRGYTTRWATNLVMNLMPRGARIIGQPDVEMANTVKHGVDQAGRTFAQAAIEAPPGGTVELSWSYTVPRAMVRNGAGWHFTDSVTVQNTVNPFVLRITVLAPDGWALRQSDTGQYWGFVDNGANLQIIVGAPITLSLDLVPN